MDLSLVNKPVQMSHAKPVWNPLTTRKKRSYSIPFCPTEKYTKLVDDFGTFRDAPFVLSVDAGWQRRCPEQLNIQVTGIHGSMMVALNKSIRRPSGWSLYTSKGKRKPDKYYQNSKHFVYDLGTPEHVIAFRELIHHVVSYSYGMKNPGAFTDIYKLEIGSSKELYRRELPGLRVWNPDKRKSEATAVKNGYETLSICCEPGEKPRMPDILLTGNPATKEFKEAQKKHLRRCAATRRYVFRVRRFGFYDGDVVPACYFIPEHELTIPIESVERMAQRLPWFWDATLDIFAQRGNNEDTRVIKHLRNAQSKKHLKLLQKTKHDWEAMDSQKQKRNRLRWQENTVLAYCDAVSMHEACTAEPEHGLFLLTEEDLHNEQLRAAMMAAGMLRWCADWDVSLEQADREAESVWLRRTYLINVAIRTFISAWSLRTVKSDSLTYTNQIDQLKNVVDIFKTTLARGPPV